MTAAAIGSAGRGQPCAWRLPFEMKVLLQKLSARLALGLALLPVAAAAPAAVAPLADHHQHLFSPAIVKLIASPDGKGPGEIRVEDVIAHLNAAGIRHGVVMSVAYMYGRPSRVIEDEYAKVRAENDWTADQVARYPARLKAFCGINPLKEYALDEIARCAAHPVLRTGLKMHFGNSDVQLANPAHLERMRQVFRAANASKMAIAIHMRASISLNRPYGPEQAHLFLEELMPLASDITVQVAHLAGAGPGYDDPASDWVMSILASAFEQRDPRTRNLWFDVASMVDKDISTVNRALVARRIRQVGVDKILYGSDAATSNNQLPREAWAAFRRIPLSDAEFKRIAGNLAPYLK